MASGYPRGRDQRNRVHQAVQACRNCRRPMLWVTMASGKRNPLDLEPSTDDPAANVLLVERENPQNGEAWRLGLVIHDVELLEEARELGLPTHRSHFADMECPGNADRRPRERADLA